MENDSDNLAGLGVRSFRCVLVKSNASSDDQNYHLMVVSNHSVGDGTSGMILANQILTLYDQAIQKPEVLEREINAEIVKTWREAIQPDIPNGTENYEVGCLYLKCRIFFRKSITTCDDGCPLRNFGNKSCNFRNFKAKLTFRKQLSRII